MKKIYLLFIGVLLLTSTYAQTWEPTYGPPHARVYAFESFLGKLYIGTENGNFYSTNNGDTWQELPVPTGAYDYEVSGGKLFLGSDDGLFVSSDGLTWTNIPAVTANIFNVFADGTSLYAKGLYQDLFYSADNGLTWTNINGTLPTDISYGLTKIGSTVYVSKGISTISVYSSSDNGATWNSTPFPAAGSWVNTLATDGSTLFAGTGSGDFYYSTDGANTWTMASTGLIAGGQSIEEIFVDGTTLYAATRGGIYKSTIGSYNWTLFGMPGTFVRTINRVGTDFFAGTEQSSVYRSTDGGASWQQLYDGIYADINIEMIASDGVRIYGKGTNSDLWSSSDNGDTWNLISSVPGYELYADPNVVIAWDVNDPNIYVSTDNGFTFTTVGHPNLTYHIIRSGSTLYSGGFDGLQKSTDNGMTWSFVTVDSFNPHIKAMLAVGSTIILSAENAIYRSTDGVTWTEVAALSSSGESGLTATNTHMFAITTAGLHASADDGVTWSPVAGIGLPPDTEKFIEGLGNDLYVYNFDLGPFGGETPNGIYVSSDAGATFTQVNNGLDELNFRDLAIHNGVLYGSVGYAGVYRFNPGSIPTGIADGASDGEFTLFPNPTEGVFNVNTTGNKNAVLKIYTATGLLIRTEQYSGQKAIDMSAEAKGLYIIELSNEEKTSFNKLMVK